MKYYVPQGEDYNKEARELYFIMGDDGIVYPVEFELIHGGQYLRKIGADDQNYYCFGQDHRYALAMKVQYKNPDGSTYKNQQEIFFKSKSECNQAYTNLYVWGVTEDGGEILKVDYGMYDDFMDW